MTARDDFDRLLTVWLDETAGAGTPGYLDETLDGLARLEQRPAWMSPGRWLPMQLTMPRVLIPRAVPILLLIALVIAALVAGLVIVGSQQRLPPPFGPARTGLLVYDAEGDLFVHGIDGQARLIVGGPETASDATWSRDGTKIAYWTGEPGGIGRLHVATADGSGDRVVAADVRLSSALFSVSSTWSPDGARIAFSAGLGEIEVVGADGSDRHVVGDSALLRYDPAWSPDGTLIAFRGQETSGMDSPRNVFVIRPDGTGQQVVSQTSYGVNSAVGPNWSPDGRLLYDAVVDVSGGGDAGDIVVATRGSIGWTEDIVIRGDTVDWLPRWSNDGSRIVFLRSRPGTSEGDQVIADADGSDAHVISDRIMSTAGACWAPDDRSIAAMTGQLDMPIDGQVAATYVIYDVATGAVLTEMHTPRGVSMLDCSWQRLAT
jgi:Tol biopolymer transport system component